jgi:hypothetical protein
VYGKQTTGAYLTAVGYNAASSVTGNYNSAFGQLALASLTSGASNTAIGDETLSTVITGSDNVAVGASALYNATGSSNTAVGVQGLAYTTTGEENAALGSYAMRLNTTGSFNTGIGRYALTANTTGAYNTASGYESLKANTTASYNTAIGYSAGYNTTTGGVTAVGAGALAANTTGYANTALGGYDSATTVQAALRFNTTGTLNVAVGTGALTTNTTGNSHTAVGFQALFSNTTATGSTAIGYRAGYSCTAGDNVFIGYEAGQYITATTSGGSNAIVGAYSRGSGATVNFEYVFGYNLAAKGTQTFFVGGTSGAYNSANTTTWSTTSDQRLKKNIADNNDGLSKINSIRVRNFEYRLPEEVDAELKPTDAIQKSGVQLGVIAQELQAILPECVKTESTGVMSVNSDNLTWYMINAIKELKAENDSLKARLDAANL